jgi:hypothetical protein
MKLRLLTLLGMLTLLAYPVAAAPAVINCVKHPEHCLTPIVAPTQTPAPADTALPAPTKHAHPTPTAPSGDPTLPSPAPGQAQGSAYPGAPLCASHSNATYHSLWNSALGCHYDHEHGADPFTAQVAAAFPGFDLYALLGNVQIGHTNPSSPMENTHKHGGFKWQVQTHTPHGCETGFESAQTGVSAAAIQYHAFGDYAVEFEARVHSTMALLRQCRPGDPTDYGYVYVVRHQDYGQRVVPYQGRVMAYPDSFNPPYASGLGPYFTLDCFGTGILNRNGNVACRDSLGYTVSRRLNANSIWTSKGGRTGAQGLFNLLFRVRDNYQLLDSADLVHPFTFGWLCSSDAGRTYNPAACRYNNTTTSVHEVAGVIPTAWDGLAHFDTDPRPGRITGEGYVTLAGALNLGCTAPGTDCFPLKLVGAFTGSYGTLLIDSKENQFLPSAQPERDLYFCGGVLCTEESLGAVPSGWVGPSN